MIEIVNALDPFEIVMIVVVCLALLVNIPMGGKRGGGR